MLSLLHLSNIEVMEYMEPMILQKSNLKSLFVN